MQSPSGEDGPDVEPWLRRIATDHLSVAAEIMSEQSGTNGLWMEVTEQHHRIICEEKLQRKHTERKLNKVFSFVSIHRDKQRHTRAFECAHIHTHQHLSLIHI